MNLKISCIYSKCLTLLWKFMNLTNFRLDLVHRASWSCTVWGRKMYATLALFSNGLKPQPAFFLDDFYCVYIALINCHLEILHKAYVFLVQMTGLTITIYHLKDWTFSFLVILLALVIAFIFLEWLPFMVLGKNKKVKKIAIIFTFIKVHSD